MSFPTINGMPSELKIVNAILAHCLLPSVTDFPSDPESDAQVALRIWRDKYLSLSSDGFYSLNRVDAYAVTASPTGEVVIPNTIQEAVLTSGFRSQYPNLTYSRALGKVVDKIDRSKVEHEDLVDQEVYFDVVTYPPPIEDAPLQYINLVLAHTLFTFGQGVGVPIDESFIQTASLAMLRLEVATEPTRNVFDNPTTSQTWRR